MAIDLLKLYEQMDEDYERAILRGLAKTKPVKLLNKFDPKKVTREKKRKR